MEIDFLFSCLLHVWYVFKPKFLNNNIMSFVSLTQVNFINAIIKSVHFDSESVSNGENCIKS